MDFKRYFPVLTWLPTYQRAYLKGDISAGLTVGIMLIPQGMAYAYIAGLPPEYGLYAALIPQIVYAFMGTARQLAVGPVAMDSLLVAAGVGAVASSKEEYIALAILLAFMMGLVQLTAGVIRLGFLVNFLSRPVISGFTSAAALIIGLNQLKHLMGTDIPRSNKIYELLYAAWGQISELHMLTFLLGIGGILLIKIVKKWNKSIPAALVVVVLGIALVGGLGLDKQGVKIVENIPSGLPAVSLPDVQNEKLYDLIPVIFTLALIAFMEAISVAKALQAKHKEEYEIDANQELIALGLSNVVGSVFQSYPTTGGFSRSAVNDQAGAKTGVAPIVSAALIALTLLFLTPLFYYLPKAVLASIIMVAVFGLIDTRYPRFLWKNKKEEWLMYMVTFVITLTIGISQGILFGVAISFIIIIYHTTFPHYAILGKFEKGNEYRNIKRFEEVVTREDILIIRYDASLYFANASHFKDTLQSLVQAKGEALKLVILNAESIDTVDSSAIEMLKDLMGTLQKAKIQFYWSGVKGPVRDILHRVDLVPQIGEEHFFLDIQAAVDYYDNNIKDDWVKYSNLYAKQYNA